MGCERVFGEDLAVGFQQGCLFCFERVEVAQDAFEGVFNAEHGFAVVPVAVAAGVRSVGMSFGRLRMALRTNGVFVVVFGVSVGVSGVCGHWVSFFSLLTRMYRMERVFWSLV